MRDCAALTCLAALGPARVPSLAALDVSGCNLGGAEQICAALNALAALRHLELSEGAGGEQRSAGAPGGRAALERTAQAAARTLPRLQTCNGLEVSALYGAATWDTQSSADVADTGRRNPGSASESSRAVSKQSQGSLREHGMDVAGSEVSSAAALWRIVDKAGLQAKLQSSCTSAASNLAAPDPAPADADWLAQAFPSQRDTAEDHVARIRRGAPTGADTSDADLCLCSSHRGDP